MGIGIGTIHETLVDNNIPRRSKGKSKIDKDEYCKIVDMYKSGVSVVDISNKYNIGGTTVRRILHTCNVSLKTVVNEHYFDSINTEEKAYLFGLFCADGWIHRERIGLYLSKDDKYMVDLFAHVLSTKSPYAVKKDGEIKGYCIEIYSKYLVEKMIEYGISNNKSYDLRFPDIITPEFYPDFIRGYFDGDGCIYKNTTSIIGTKWFISRVIEIVSSCAGVSNKVSMYNASRNKDNDITKCVMWSGKNQAKKIMNWMYKNESATIYLKRKHDKYMLIN